MSDEDKNPQKLGPLGKRPAALDTPGYVLMDAVNELSRQIDRLDDKFDRKVDGIKAELTTVRERTAVVENATSSLPELDARVQRIERWLWRAAGAIVVLGWGGTIAALFIRKFFRSGHSAG